MNEITRIHIAKTPFSIEDEAKKVLDVYLRTLESNLADAEVYGDIEQRMVEILEQRRVLADGVIGLDDVKAIQAQLGDPQEFAADEGIGLTPVSAGKRLLRDPQTAMLGGVASGIAAFVGIEVVWVRLIMLLALIGSFGTATLIYIVLWVVMPPAKNAADRLAMAGKPVTASTIREMSTQVGSMVRNNDRAVWRVVTLCLGVGLVMATIGALAASVVGGYGFLFHDAAREGWYGVAGHETMYAVTGLFVTSGVLLAGLFTVLAYASFVQKINKKMLIAVSTIVVLGLVSFGLGAGVMYQTVRQQSEYVNAHTKETAIAVAGDLRQARQLEVSTAEASLDYVVSDQSPKVALTAFSDKSHPQPKPVVNVENGRLKVSLDGRLTTTDTCGMPCGRYQITVYGPALESISVKSGNVRYISQSQDSLKSVVGAGQSLVIDQGSIGTLNVSADKDATINASGTSIETVNVVNTETASANFGNVRNLSIVNRQSCPSYVISPIEVDGISGTLTVNGVNMAVASVRMPCLEIRIPKPIEPLGVM